MKTALFCLTAGLALASAAPALANAPAQGIRPAASVLASGHDAGTELALASAYKTSNKTNNQGGTSRHSPPPVGRRSR